MADGGHGMGRTGETGRSAWSLPVAGGAGPAVRTRHHRGEARRRRSAPDPTHDCAYERRET